MYYTPFLWVGGIIMILWWVLIIVLIVALIRWITGRSRHYMYYDDHRKDRSALSIIKERYARGEINKQEYEEKKRDLSSD